MAIPKRDPQLVPFSTNWNTRLNADFASFDITDAQAKAYTDLHVPYIAAVSALTTAREAGTRSKSLTETRDTTRDALLKYARELYTTIQADNAVTDANKVLLGIHIRKTEPSRVPPPTERPGMEVVSVVARTVEVRIWDTASSTKRGKPANAVSAFVYTFAGATYPTDPTLWQFNGPATKSTYEIVFPDTIANGAQVWVCAAWVNRKGETGPVSVPVTTFVQGGLSMAA
jgi:hypothetical protein